MPAAADDLLRFVVAAAVGACVRVHGRVLGERGGGAVCVGGGIGAGGGGGGGGGGFGFGFGGPPARGPTVSKVCKASGMGRQGSPGGYLTPGHCARGPPTWGLAPGVGAPRESIRRSLECSLPVLPLDNRERGRGMGGGDGQREGMAREVFERGEGPKIYVSKSKRPNQTFPTGAPALQISFFPAMVTLVWGWGGFRVIPPSSYGVQPF